MDSSHPAIGRSSVSVNLQLLHFSASKDFRHVELFGVEYHHVLDPLTVCKAHIDAARHRPRNACTGIMAAPYQTCF